jgi:hypothetical protein
VGRNALDRVLVTGSASIATLAVVVSCGDNLGGGAQTAESPEAVAIDTVAPESVRAGDPIEVSCVFFDDQGLAIEPIPVPSTRVRFAPADAVIEIDDGEIIATRTGELEVSCASASLVLFDPSPSLIAVEPGEVSMLSISIDRDRITAGESVAATCSAFDAWGNPVDGVDPTLVVAPERPGNAIAGLTASFTGSGQYQLACDLPNAATAAADLEVLPDLPAAIVVSPVPSRPVYARGEIIELGHQVVDRFDNPVPEASVAIASSPVADVTDGIHFRYFANGFYQLTATVQGPTDEGALLEASAMVLIDGSGPAIACDNPIDGAMIDHTPGAPVGFSGSVSGLAGITEVQVNGSPVAVDGAGRFSVNLPTRFGINFVELAAIDEFGKESTRVCSFLAADLYIAEDGSQSGAVTMNLRQASVDDNNRGGPFNSLGDLFHSAINSAGLKAMIHDLLIAANPLKDSCDIDTWFGCAFRSRIDYLSSNFAGLNTVLLDLVNGGIEVRLTLDDARLRMRIRASLGIDTTGWITVDTATVRAIFDASLSGGRPRLTLRPGSVQTTVGSIDTDFSGLSGWIVDVVASFAEGTIRNLIANQVSNLIRTSLGGALDDLIANLDISALERSFDVARLDGGPPIAMSFVPSFSHVNANNSRLQLALGTRLTAPAAHARPSLGAAIERPPGPLDPAGGHPAAVAIHSGVINQALHALWRGGMFDATLDAGGATAALAAGLPPVVTMNGADRVEIALGDVAVNLDIPNVFPEPVPMLIGMRGSMRYQRVGDDISFDDFRIDELFFTSLQVAIDAENRDLIEGFLAEVLENVVGTALNDALPALPIPSFDLPASLSQFGLPAGLELRINAPALTAARPQILLLGSLVVQ